MQWPSNEFKVFTKRRNKLRNAVSKNKSAMYKTTSESGLGYIDHYRHNIKWQI